MPHVSVILPVYNGERTLEKAIDSILCQTLSEFELIVIDDGSEDKSSKLVNSYKDPRIQYVIKNHSGIAPSLNEGIRISCAKYIARMDADDLSHPKRLAKQYNYLEEHPEIDVLASNVRYTGSNVSEGFSYYVNWQNQLIDHDDMRNNRFVDSPLVHPTVMVRKVAFEKYGNYRETDGPEDFELWLRWMERGAKFSKLKEELLDWRDHDDRMTRTSSNYSKEKFFKLKALYFAEWFKNDTRVKNMNIWIIGTGRTVFQRTDYLLNSGLKIHGFVDFKSKSTASRRIISYEDLPFIKNPFFLSYVSDRVGKVRIKKFLGDSGFSESKDFYMMA